ncbi:MAG: GntR family transcriptional regulator [Planctomycetota bacterium]|jgi:DNA-binding LacI/PurR family transcriptional regulator
MPVRKTLTDKFAGRLRQEIRAGRYKSGKALPSERAIAEKYGISRVTARRSLKQLCSERLIEARPARGYFVVPGAMAQASLREARSLLFIQRGATGRPTLDSIHTQIVNGALGEAHERGLEVYIMCQDLRDFRHTLSTDWGRRLRGVLLDWARPDIARLMLEENVPFVLVETDMEGMEVTTVIQDNVGGVQQAMGNVLEADRRRIALICGDVNSIHIQQRVSGYREFLLRNRLPRNPGWVVEDSLDDRGGRRAAAAALDCAEPPDALIVCHREMIGGVLAELVHRNLKYPDDVSVIAWGDPDPGEIGGEFTDISYVHWCKEEMGQMAVRALEERIKVGHPERMVFRIGTSVVDCGSVLAPAAHD